MMRSPATVLTDRRGMATLVALIVIAMLILIGLAALSASRYGATVAERRLDETRAFYAAEAGLEKAAARMHSHFDTAAVPPEVYPHGEDTVNACVVSYRVVRVDKISANRPLDDGGTAEPESGFRFEVVSTAAGTRGDYVIELEGRFDVVPGQWFRRVDWKQITRIGSNEPGRSEILK